LTTTAVAALVLWISTGLGQATVLASAVPAEARLLALVAALPISWLVDYAVLRVALSELAARPGVGRWLGMVE
jgi:hypothetical protein